ncbi:MAG: universal stress protein, partial [Gammaproteobacteria bacterium]|nr:universal stress protein [Gammaproteobacteria bacterium]
PATEIIEQAEMSSMDVIVMGRRDKGDLVRAMLGSTTEEVIGGTHSDVLVIPRGAEIKAKGLVLPVDGSRYSQAAAVTALNLATQCNVPITVVSVAVDERLKDDAQSHADQAFNLLSEANIKAAVDVRVGRPDEEIVACAREHGADLIVMGSHGRTGLERLLVGSVSERVIGQTECPVMVVKL